MRIVRGEAQHLGSQLLHDPPDRLTEATGEQTTAELSARRDALLAAILQATAGKRQPGSGTTPGTLDGRLKTSSSIGRKS